MISKIIKFLRSWFIYKILGKEGIEISTVYTTLIVRGIKVYCDVPEILREQVAIELEALDLGHLAVCEE